MCAETKLDSMYLDNLDEFINDEGRIITCKWLCLTLKVHVNVAKQMLYHYVTKHRNEDKGDDLCVTYVVSGVVAGKDKQPDIQKVMLVREEKLDAVKSTMKNVISVHIYSVSKSKLKDLNILYTSNIDEVKKNLTSMNSYGGIECSSAKVRSSADLAKLQQQNAYRDPEESAAPEKKNKTEEKVRKDEIKTEVKATKTSKKANNQIASMFARQNVKSETKDEKKEVKTAPSKRPTPGNKKSGGISAFFNKGPTPKQSQTPDSSKSSPVKTESPDTESPIKSETDTTSPVATESLKSSIKTESQDSISKDSEIESMEVDSSPPKKAKVTAKSKSKPKPKPKPKKSSQKRGKSKHSDDESPIPKRKRIMQLSDSESSSEEENEEEEESPIPDPSRIESDEEIVPSPVKEEPIKQEYSQNGKPKKKKLVSKTFQDEKGFFVTKKEFVFVTDSEDETEVVKSDQENIPVKKNDQSPQKVSSTKSPQKKSVKSPTKKNSAKSPSKKHSKDLTKTKQSSITSFFTKK
ncbi:DNA polymerase delta subunit 3-like isoform X2 [Palaemon carinicauda]|uniref:DNA polymerase delta subunit 3-like isoform X2 n=1 Tax=Palaemon carinicauda TaxID=392227 RepID=UPI0035B690C9